MIRNETLPLSCPKNGKVDLRVIYAESSPWSDLPEFEVSRSGRRNPKTGEWMHFYTRFIPATLATCAVLLALPTHSFAQKPAASLGDSAAAELPETPQPQLATADISVFATEREQGQATGQPTPASTSMPDSSSAQAAAAQSGTEKSDREKAEEQIKEQEKQRVAGVLPQFNISYRADAVSMSAGQKLRLAFRSATDPVTFGAAFLVAGYHETSDSDSGFPWGAKGYGERVGASYLDSFNGTMIGNGIFPALLHQDPRYFRLGHGTATHRLLYAAATSFICKHDKTGKWEPNYSNVLGNIAAGGLSNLYYPSNNSGIGLTISTGFIVTAEGAVGAEFDEFWPDISRKFLHRDPTHGLDAQARAQDKTKKETQMKQPK